MTMMMMKYQLAISNALRYFAPKFHAELAAEFRQELDLYGHIYMYRLLPEFDMKAYPISEYPCRIKSAAAVMHMVEIHFNSISSSNIHILTYLEFQIYFEIIIKY